MSSLLEALGFRRPAVPRDNYKRQVGFVEKGDSWSKPVAPGATVELMSRQAPSGCWLRVVKVGNYLGQVEGWGVGYWEVLVNGAVVLRIRDQIGYSAARELVTAIRVPGGSELSVNGINPGAVALDMGITLQWEEWTNG